MKVDNTLFFAAVEERLEAGERVKITLVGSSMQPTLCEGDAVTLEPLAYSSTTAERRSPSPTLGEELDSKKLAEEIITLVGGSIDYQYKFHLDTLTAEKLQWSFTYRDGHSDTWEFYRSK